MGCPNVNWVNRIIKQAMQLNMGLEYANSGLPNNKRDSPDKKQARQFKTYPDNLVL